MIELGHLQVVSIKPGDVIVLTCPGEVSRSLFERLSREMKTTFPGHQILIVDCGATISVVRPEQ